MNSNKFKILFDKDFRIFKGNYTNLKYSKVNIFLLLLLFLLTNIITAQTQRPQNPTHSQKPKMNTTNDSVGFIMVNGYVEKNLKPLENTSIIVYRNNKKINHLRTPPSGKFNLRLPFNQYFKIEITKQGMVTKKFDFDTKLPLGVSNKQIFPFEFTIVLFPKYNYIDMSVLDKPLAVIRYDKQYEDFFYDYTYAKTINDKVVYIQTKIEDLTKEYAKCVDDGRELLDKKEYILSLAKFKRANEIFPDEPYPIEKIALIKKILAEKKGKRGMFNDLVKLADEAYTKEEYEKSISFYQQSLEILPDEPYPPQRIRDIKKLMSNLGVKEAQYNSLIAKSDKLFDSRKFSEARKGYLDASIIFPNRPYPKERINEIDKLLGNKQNLLATYNKLVGVADKLYSEKKYKDALSPYTEANKLFPEEKHPRDRIDEINKLLTVVASNDDNYNNLIEKADKLFTSKDYQNAKTSYKGALGIKPEEIYPKTKIAEIDKILADIQAGEKDYYKIIADADKLLKAKDYINAKTIYIQASKIKPGEVYPKLKISEINSYLTEQSAIQAKYDKAVKEGDKFFNLKDYPSAKAFYEVAENIKPDEKYPPDKIGEINKLLNDVEAQKRQYGEYIVKADKLFAKQTYEKARDNYIKASQIFPEEKYPKTKINDINKLLASSKETEELYNTAIKEADNYFGQKDYENSLTAYKKANQIKPDEKYPKDRIAYLTKLLNSLKDADASYKAAISIADKMFENKDYQNSKSNYQNASDIKPNEQYPKDRIIEINNILKLTEDIQSKQFAYDKVIVEADKYFNNKDWNAAKNSYNKASSIKPQEEYPKTRIAQIDKLILENENLEIAYKTAINEADNFYTSKSYEKALTSYQKASELKSYEKYPKDRITYITKLIANLKDVENSYKTAITQADKQFENKDYQNAKNSYQNATDIKPNEQYPKDKINEINTILKQSDELQTKQYLYDKAIVEADKYFNTKDWKPAKNYYNKALSIKPQEDYPKTKIAQIDKLISENESIETAYKTFIFDGDNQYNSKSYEKALLYYQKALDLKPNEKYPKERIAGINKFILNLKETEESYQAMLTDANNKYNSKEYQQSRVSYQKASEIKPEEVYPKDRINEINKLLGDLKSQKLAYDKAILEAEKLYNNKEWLAAKTSFEKASSIIPNEELPKTRIGQINKILADFEATELAYKSAIKSGDEAYENKSYELAIKSYQKASEIKPNEKYPTDKINEINKMLDDLRNKEFSFKQAIIDADKLYSEKSYEKSRDTYKYALTFKPDDSYSQKRIEEINTLLSELQAQNKLYNNIINDADNLLTNKEYDKAKNLYQQAINISPNEEYPKNQISNIDKLIADIELKKDAYKKVIIEADNFYDVKDYKKAKSLYLQASVLLPNEQYPKDRLDDIAKRMVEVAIIEESFNKTIVNADRAMYSKDYDNAKEMYEKASQIKPNEKYPKDKLEEIDKIIKSFAANQQLYTKTIVEADNFYKQLQYREAREQYKKARDLNPTQKYPREKITELNDVLRKEEYEKAIGEIKNEQILKQKEKKYSFTPLTDKKGNNYVMIKAKNLSNKSFNVIMSFGKDEERSGGFVFKMEINQEATDYIVRVNTQESWYKVDNNWISLSPLGGDIEVVKIQIVQGN